MRLVGGRDYYDSGLQYGVDLEIVFVRSARQVPALHPMPHCWGGVPALELRSEATNLRNRWHYRETTFWEHRRVQYELEAVYVILCDRLYRGCRVKWSSFLPSWELQKIHGARTAETFWDRNALAKFLAKHGAGLKPVKLPPKNTAQRKPEKFFENRALDKEELAACLSSGVVCATHSPADTMKMRRNSREEEVDCWQVNAANLHEYDLIKLVDPVQAFQRISMWVGGVLPKPGAQMVQITDDKIKLAKHGMDHTSFRRPKENVR